MRLRVAALFIFFSLGLFSAPLSAKTPETSELLSRLAQVDSSAVNSSETVHLLSFLKQGLETYHKMNDYRAMFKKRELSDGVMGDEEIIFLKFSKPFKIFMHWVSTHKKGLQVLYERGRHDGKLAIHKPGLLLGLAPVVFLERSSPWVREGSESYDIEDAGIGSFLHDFSAMVLQGLEEGKLSAVRPKDKISGWDVSFPGTKDDDAGYFASRVEVHFDPANSLPTQMTLYDWEGRVTGTYEYADLTLDVGANDPEFKKLAQKQLYKLYLPPAAPQATKSNFGAKRS